jgi:hypothetical protein
MARADLYKLANYSMKLFKMIREGQELEGWVQAKITKAADYIASVYHFMEYEMKASEYGDKLENSDVYSESVRLAFQQKLMEAKRQAEKVKKQTDKVEEGFDDLEKYMKEKDKPKPSGGAGKKQGKAYGGSKQKDDDKEKDVKEGFEEMQKYLEKKRGPQPSGGSGIKKGSRYGGSKQAADKEDEEDEKPKKDKKVKESSKPDYLDFDKDGNKKEPMKKALKDKKIKEGGDKLPSPPDEVHLPKKGSKHGPVDVYRKKTNEMSKGCNQTMEGKSCPVHGLKECPMEEAVKKGLYYNVNKRKAAGTSRDKNHPKAPNAKDWKDAAKTAKK